MFTDSDVYVRVKQVGGDFAKILQILMYQVKWGGGGGGGGGTAEIQNLAFSQPLELQLALT